MQQFSVGFIVSGDNVLLIRKNRPDWQNGKFNGIGGKLEEGETPLDAMVRECREECGLYIPHNKWEHQLTITGTSYCLDVFLALVPTLEGYQSLTDERVDHFNIYTLPTNLIASVRWILPFCLIAGVAKPVVLVDNEV